MQVIAKTIYNRKEAENRLRMRRLTCCVCGEDGGRWTQHYNRDDGFGICRKCVTWLRGRGCNEEEIANLYGQENINWG